MSGPSFDDTLDYWADNPDEREPLEVRCLHRGCGFVCDDADESAAHLRAHEIKREEIDGWVVAYDIWTDAA